MDTKANTGGGKKLNIHSLCSETYSNTFPVLCVCYRRVCLIHKRRRHTQVYDLKVEKMNINHFYKKRFETPPSFKLCLKNVPMVNFNIASANLAKRTRANGTKPLLSFYIVAPGLAEAKRGESSGLLRRPPWIHPGPVLSIYSVGAQ